MLNILLSLSADHLTIPYLITIPGIIRRENSAGAADSDAVVQSQRDPLLRISP